MFAIFDNKNWEISKSDLTILYLNGIDTSLLNVFSSLNFMKLVTQNYQKKGLCHEIPAPKKVPLLKK